ncbi:hypothetical protein [Marinigracilibium pacificum]|uniref:AMP-binding enzyme n=1 Tax=Marinigracilibium pacificum TaxID=2729599 RepID=A0A848J353_9BACT|nr:hypothetical protein [Marinigracilibium pacificum]NMM49935.1 hypothetical protein [Marinigracilibium pacificum]
MIDHYHEIVSKVNEGLSHTEKIKKFKLISIPWTFMQSNGHEAELTPTLKLKRRVIEEKYKNQIDEMYETDPSYSGAHDV